jgi:hypothetical protein
MYLSSQYFRAKCFDSNYFGSGGTPIESVPYTLGSGFRYLRKIEQPTQQEVKKNQQKAILKAVAIKKKSLRLTYDYPEIERLEKEIKEALTVYIKIRAIRKSIKRRISLLLLIN